MASSYIVVVPLLMYLVMKSELTPQEICMNSITMFRAGVETVRCLRRKKELDIV